MATRTLLRCRPALAPQTISAADFGEAMAVHLVVAVGGDRDRGDRLDIGVVEVALLGWRR